MKEKKLYECDFCHTAYADKKKACECEHNHKAMLEIKDARYLPVASDKTGLPDKICVKFEDGTTAWYKR